MPAGDITYDDIGKSIVYNSADISYDGDTLGADRWGWGQDYDVGTDVTSGTASAFRTKALSGANDYVTWVSPTNTATFDKPSSLLDGDLMVACFCGSHGGVSAPAITSSGWTQLAKVGSSGISTSLVVLWKIALSEGSSWTFTGNSQIANAIGILVIFDGGKLENLGTSPSTFDTTVTGSAASPPLTRTLGSSTATNTIELGLSVMGGNANDSLPTLAVPTDESTVHFANDGGDVDRHIWAVEKYSRAWNASDYVMSSSAGTINLIGGRFFPARGKDRETDSWEEA